jgi:8-oxo-dGTP pyrophosphatase MutT (NUDIX family)
VAKVPAFIRHVLEWLSHIHTVVWILESVGAGALIAVSLAAAQRLLHSNVDWMLIAFGFGISTLMIYLSFWILRRGGETKAAGKFTGQPDRNIFANYISGVEPASNESTLVADSKASVSGSPETLPDVTAFFVALGVLEISKNGRPKCVSESAEAFLASLQAHFLDGNERYFGDWSATETSERPRLAAMLAEWEEYRRTSAPTGDARPSRKARVAVALIRADLADQPRFIMLDNPKWNPKGAWWFVGGGPKAHDKGDRSKTVVREACEELALQPADIGPPHLRGTASEKRVSRRIGSYTEYFYDVFALQIVRNKPGLFVVEGRVLTEARMEHFRWLTWDEILNSDHLNSHALCIVRLLQQIDPRSIPQSGNLRPT